MSKTVNDRLSKLLVQAYFVLITVAVLYLLYGHFFQADKIAYVDSGKILNEYKGAVTAKKEYQSKAKVWQANIDTLTERVKSSIANYEKTLAKMSPKEQALAKELIQTKQKQLTDYQKAIQDNARAEDTKLTQRVVADVNSFLLDYGKRNHYKMILIANQSGTIAYAREGLDITASVLDELNSGYASK
ncbi:periplasmic chaperone for outer membrane proteins Skp [Mucilaginibacter yixingensis]|uniref:Periplasmic chaperone for outer membrane proteins Skp n=1 Tax=Mucilaginibacter yixingensis TaxID=1295612 RepID=A0A2T5J4S2_9SPHI|nr:OmpH family outer membrane protein [Mucilaginibacter yixingensis]PTQ92449.1 periplasmic chaperone for outer membrane proteins Skp [Mucilaginibacter yixingensis]